MAEKDRRELTVIEKDSAEANTRGVAYKMVNNIILIPWRSDTTPKDLFSELPGIILICVQEERGSGGCFRNNKDYCFIVNKHYEGHEDIDTIGVFIPENHRQTVLREFEENGIFVGWRQMRTEDFQRECKKVAFLVAKKRMLSRGWKGRVPRKTVEVLEDVLMGLFETCLLEKRLYETLLGKQKELRRMVIGLKIHPKTLPAESHIDMIIERSRARYSGVEACLEMVTGEDARFIQQINFSENEVREMDQYIEKEVRMLLGKELDDLLSNKAGQ